MDPLVVMKMCVAAQDTIELKSKAEIFDAIQAIYDAAIEELIEADQAQELIDGLMAIGDA